MKNNKIQLIPSFPYKTRREWHVYHVFNDPEFQNLVQKLNKDFKIIGYKNGHIGTPKEIGLRYKAIIDEYKIKATDIDFFIGGLHEQGSIKKDQRYSIILDSIENKFNAEYDLNISKEEFLESWDYIQKQRKIRKVKETRRKPPENTELVYAIFKARKKYSFAEIFSLYINSKLPLYNRRPVYQSEEVLESFYNRNKPKATE